MKKLLVALLLLAGLVAFLLAVVVVLLTFPGLGSGPVVLVWHLDGAVAERAPGGGSFLPALDGAASLGEIYSSLRSARTDDNATALAVHIGRPAFGLARGEELRRQIDRLRQAGKTTECYLEAPGEGPNDTLAYYLASACDHIHAPPAASINLLGLYAEGLFLGSTLDKLGIEADFLAVGRYKSAPEQYTRRGRSAPAREAVSALLDRDFERLIADIAAGRGLDPDGVRRIFDGAPHSGDEAVALGLVDSLLYPDEFREHLASVVGGEPAYVDLPDYQPGRGGAAGKIAVVFAEGTIVQGRGGLNPWTGERFLGSKALGATLSRLREDSSVDAVVLRVDSPGGSAFAADNMLREVRLLAAEKPVVASLADVAASGGYYVAVGAQQIVAESTSVTGSIGVYLGKLVTGPFEEELLGITHDPLTRGARADLYSSRRPFSAAEADHLQAQLIATYERFLAAVAEGRGLSTEAVDGVAQGRVWAGADALERGLVDQLGGLDAALDLAAEAAGLASAERAMVVFYPRPPGLLDFLLDPGEELSLRVGNPHEHGLLRRLPGLLELPSELSALARPF